MRVSMCVCVFVCMYTYPGGTGRLKYWVERGGGGQLGKRQGDRVFVGVQEAKQIADSIPPGNMTALRW